MARLDRLIQVLYEQRADALQLVVGKPATLVANGATRALTKDPLTDAQILTLVREVADAESAARLGGSEDVSFPYRSPSGQVTVALTPGAGGPAVEVRAVSGAAGAGYRLPSRHGTAAPRPLPALRRERQTLAARLAAGLLGLIGFCAALPEPARAFQLFPAGMLADNAALPLQNAAGLPFAVEDVEGASGNDVPLAITLPSAEALRDQSADTGTFILIRNLPQNVGLSSGMSSGRVWVVPLREAEALKLTSGPEAQADSHWNST